MMFDLLVIDSVTEVTHRFSQCCGKNVTFKNNGSTACRVRSYDHGLLFSADPLRAEELFEVSHGFARVTDI